MRIQFKFFNENDDLSFAFWWEGDAAGIAGAKAEAERIATFNNMTTMQLADLVLRMIGEKREVHDEHQAACAACFVIRSMSDGEFDHETVVASIRVEGERLRMEVTPGELLN
jgi:hypothetical protein